MDLHGASVASCARWSGWLRAALGCCLCVVPLLEGQAATIYVKLLVDEEEPAVERLWQQRLQTRLERASEIISQYCDIRFTTAGFGTWQSDNSLSELNRTLREFEIEVDPAPGQIAIGFSSQYRFQKGINGLGGTRGPLRSHILLRESARTVLEPERLEALVHELGHFLGAAHSGEKGSVMRPVMGDGQVRLKSYRIHFDPLNAQLIRLVGGEVSTLRGPPFQPAFASHPTSPDSDLPAACRTDAEGPGGPEIPGVPGCVATRCAAVPRRRKPQPN